MKIPESPANKPAAKPRPQCGPSARKRLLFRVLTLLLAYAIIECAASLTLWMYAGGRGRTLKRLQAAAVTDASGADIDPRFEVLHPYLGYVLHVRDGNLAVQGTRKFSVTDYGFYDAGPPLHHRGADRVIVGITGGSVAHHFSVLSSDELAAALQPRFPGRKIEFVRLALGGYKQPQQLMTLSYILALGGELDILINIDGFNEVVLPGPENVDNGVFDAFPRSWQLRVVAGNDLQLLRRIGYVAYWREQRRQLAHRFLPVRWSPLALVLWNYWNESIENRIVLAQSDVALLSTEHLNFCAQGPSQSFASRDEMYAHFVELWRDGSLQLDRLCAANGIEYYHFLQPTRHYPRIDPSDRSGTQSGGIAERVQQGYPLLLSAGQTLQDQGVEFHDLTGLFDDSGQSVYYDFCHFGKPGNDLMAEQIGKTIVDRATPDGDR